jgi:Protein of unknown function (DUF4199)
MKKISIEIKWAIVFVVMSLLWMLGEKVTGLHTTHIDKHAVYSNFIAIPAILVYVFALLDKKKNYYKGHMTYLQGFICGLVITFFVILLSPLTQYITSVGIAPEFFPNAINNAVKNGKMTREEAEAYFNLKSYILQGLVGVPVMGLATAAIVAFFTKSKNAKPAMGDVKGY